MSTVNYENIFDRGMLINLKMGSWAARNKLSQEDLKYLPKEIVRGVYDLLDDKDQLDEIISVQNKLRNKVKSQTVPFPIDGVYFVLGKDIETVIDTVKEDQVVIAELAREFGEGYEQKIKNYASKYPKFYERAKGKYPSKENVINRFYVQYRMFQVNVPNKKLSFVSPELYKEEMKKFKNEVEEMKKEVINIIYTELLDRVATLYRQCDDGKPSQRTLNNLGELFGKVENLYADFIERDDITGMINKIKKMVGGVDAKELRNDEKFKSDFGKRMKKVAAELKALPDTELKRSIEF